MRKCQRGWQGNEVWSESYDSRFKLGSAFSAGSGRLKHYAPSHWLWHTILQNLQNLKSMRSGAISLHQWETSDLVLIDLSIGRSSLTSYV